MRAAFRPLERLAQWMETVELLHPGQRVPDRHGGTIGRLVRAFNDMLDRLETERRESGPNARPIWWRRPNGGVEVRVEVPTAGERTLER